MDDFYSVKEVAKIFKISRATIYRLINKRELTPVKLGKRTLFIGEDVERLIQKLKAQSKAQGINHALK